MRKTTFRTICIFLLLICFMLIASPVFAQGIEPPPGEVQKTTFLTILAEAAALTVWISICVAQIKSFGVKDPWLSRSAYIVGVAFGAPYRYFTYSPTLPVDWFWLVIFGLACGFIATGAYKAAEYATGGKAIKEDIQARSYTIQPPIPCPEVEYREGIPPYVPEAKARP